MGLYDRFNRKIDYLRISVTDRCNLRCLYCMPEDGIQSKPQKDLLSYEEIQRFAEAAVEAGISKIRLTGGEPLVRKDIVSLVEMLAAIPGLNDLSLTTNGLLLPEHGEKLKQAGLQRINISIDSLDPHVYRRITHTGSLDAALAGMKKALELGFAPIKINTVLMRGVNDDPADFIRLIYEYPVHVRFIEFMPIGRWDRTLFMPVNELKAKLEGHGLMGPVDGPAGAGPAKYFNVKGTLGTVGLISPMSNHFCGTCNRLRLTPDGKLRPCLFSDAEFDIKPALRHNVSKEEILLMIQDVLNDKPERHKAGNAETLKRLMYQIGG
ncbi:MAG TPA: GTP 3',8-cyclase MoaA [Anaerolineae bacterium]|nr:GTP 3',8-cyclase MoaA [Anaerolineae bacterium]